MAQRICSFLDCGRKYSAKDLCGSHYAQQRRGTALTPLNDRVNPRLRDEVGNKRCCTCKQWLPTTAFTARLRNPDGLGNCCSPCIRNRTIVNRYGISAAQYDAILEAQGGGCAICGGTDQNGRAMSVDHDHTCCSGNRACGKCVRGLLCGNCNRGIGFLQEDIARMQAAIAYLTKT